MNLSIITAAVPSLYRFVADLQSGHIGTRIPDSHFELTMVDGTAKSMSNPTSSGTKRGKGLFSNISAISNHNKSQNGRELDEKTYGDASKDSIFVGENDRRFGPGGLGKSSARIEHDPTSGAETGSRDSDGSEKMIIRQTVGWDVHYEENK